MKKNGESFSGWVKGWLKKAFVILLVVVVFAFGCGWMGYEIALGKGRGGLDGVRNKNGQFSASAAVYEKASAEIAISILSTEVRDIGELATVEYLYTDAVKFEKSAELFGKKVPFSFTTKAFVVKWDGKIKAGVDVSKITIENDAESKKLMVYIPKAEILSNEIDENSIEALDEKSGLFNPMKVEDFKSVYVESKEKMAARAIENGILDKAYENAKDIINKIVDNDLIRELEYTIEFENIEKNNI